MNRKILSAIVIMAVVLAAGCMQETTELSNSEMRNRAISETAFQIIESIHEVKNRNFSKLYPDYKTFIIWGYQTEDSTKTHPYPSKQVVAVNKYGKTYKLPEEFKKLNKKEKVEINSKKVMLQFSDAYIHIVDPNALILNNISEIPWKGNQDWGKNPSNFKDTVKSPTLTKENGMELQVYTWHLGSGEIAKWSFKKEGEELRVESTEIALEVGEWGGKVFS